MSPPGRVVHPGSMPVSKKQKSEQELEQKPEQESELDLEQKSEQKAELEAELKVQPKPGKTVVQKKPPD